MNPNYQASLANANIDSRYGDIHPEILIRINQYLESLNNPNREVKDVVITNLVRYLDIQRLYLDYPALEEEDSEDILVHLYNMLRITLMTKGKASVAINLINQIIEEHKNRRSHPEGGLERGIDPKVDMDSQGIDPTKLQIDNLDYQTPNIDAP